MSSSSSVTRLPRPPARRRVALYSHDAVGLGHTRRNLALAGALGGSGTDVLLVTGCPSAPLLGRPEGCDVVVLPAMTKTSDGYGARFWSMPPQDVARVRGEALHGLLTAFRPDLLVVDKHPTGLNGELVRTLTALRATGTRTVLGLRDVLDEPSRARAEWQAAGHDEALDRWYDQVWVYGDERVHDLTRVLHGTRVPRLPWHQTGYLVPPLPAPAAGTPYLLAAVGAGGDGGALLGALVRAQAPAGHRLVLVGGPDLPADVLTGLRAAAAPGVEVHGLRTDTRALVAGAAATITMGGYNSVCEVLATARPALVVPRVEPRLEQLVRAEAFSRHGALDLLHPAEATPAALTRWMADAVTRPATSAPGLATDGLARVGELADDLLRTATGRTVRAV
ncbi:glycosyl transferase family 28 [Auraticoccus sp. F435]|uniref:Glycosyl transferase family 28 n=1 Tax=Auraticoccus cholistanensis TaxID=2656650 RepID=A0A6A9V1N1_9ACTN|nr:glycosyl transferase family 28 [Auraticoccus cholistanensis]MVA77493.1 glycosyl transferase family 28 [Auraticoccus cholistanensis]